MKNLGAYNLPHAAPEMKNSIPFINANYAQDIFSFGMILTQISSTYINHSYSINPYLDLLGVQLQRDDPQKRPDLKTIKTHLQECLNDLGDSKSDKNNHFNSSKKLINLFLADQIRQLTLQEKTGSKGAHEKKSYFVSLSKDLEKLDASTPNAEETFKNLFMKIAIVAHHRRKRSRDQLGDVITLFFNPSCADSWSIWKKIQFPANSIYDTLHQESLQAREAMIGTVMCHGYEQLRQQIR